MYAELDDVGPEKVGVGVTLTRTIPVTIKRNNLGYLQRGGKGANHRVVVSCDRTENGHYEFRGLETL